MDNFKNETVDFIRSLEGISDQILNDKELMYSLIQLEPSLFKFVNESLKNDEDIIRATKGKATIDYEKEMYTFKVELKLKENLSEQERKYIEEQIEYWRERLELIRIDNGTYYRKNLNEEDLSAAVTFAHKLSLHPTYFEKIQLIEISDYSIMRIL